MTTRGQIREALKQGPLTQEQIEQKTGLTNLSVPLSQMANKGWLTREGARGNCIYTLVDTTSRGAVSETSPRGKGKKAGQKKAAKKPGKRAPKAPKKAAEPRTPANFIASMTHDNRLVLVEDNVLLIVFDEKQTLAIADAILTVFEK